MHLQLAPESYVVVDLDDTLYFEADFVRSGLRSIARQLSPSLGVDLFDPMWSLFSTGGDAFGWVVASYGEAAGLTVDDLLWRYRTHEPRIELAAGVRRFLDRLAQLGIPLGLITDGRSVTQRNKLRALGIEDRFTDVVISEEFGSEKPDPRNFLVFEERYPGRRFHFFGDNTAKDFVVPAQLGWETYCLVDAGQHVHRQDHEAQPRPDRLLTSFEQLEVSCSADCSPSAS